MRCRWPRCAADAVRTLQLTPTGPILIEIFPRHDDFAVRNVGLPGMIGALGACFGKVVTLDSPRARPPGTVQLASDHVPRAGARSHPADVWQPHSAMADGRHLGLRGAARASRVGPRHGPRVRRRARARHGNQPADLNAGFMDPTTKSMAYYEASLLVEYLVEAHGHGALESLVRASPMAARPTQR